MSFVVDERVNRTYPPTKTEVHTNNYSYIHTMICIKDTVFWMKVFSEKLTEKILRMMAFTESIQSTLTFHNTFLVKSQIMRPDYCL